MSVVPIPIFLPEPSPDEQIPTWVGVLLVAAYTGLLLFMMTLFAIDFTIPWAKRRISALRKWRKRLREQPPQLPLPRRRKDESPKYDPVI